MPRTPKHLRTETCQICNNTFKSKRGLCMHISYTHHETNLEEYYLKYISKIENENLCLCGNTKTLIDFVKGYRNFCPVKNCKFKIEKIVENYSTTYFKKTGYKCPFLNPEVQGKIKITNKEKYGTENVFASEYAKNKIVETNMARYGVEYAINNPEIKKKAHISYLNKYGVINPFSNNEIKNKIIETNIKKYGYANIIQNELMFEKIQKNSFGGEWIEFGDKRFFCRGYEKYFLNNLDKFGYTLEQLENKRPKIFYFFDGMTRRYYSDFYIPLAKTIIEVKSTYTFDGSPEGKDLKAQNIAKASGVLESGYNFKFIIFLDRKGSEFKIIDSLEELKNFSTKEIQRG